MISFSYMFMCTTTQTTQKKCQTSKSIVVLHKINMNSDINYDRKPCTLHLIHESNPCVSSHGQI